MKWIVVNGIVGLVLLTACQGQRAWPTLEAIRATALSASTLDVIPTATERPVLTAQIMLTPTKEVMLTPITTRLPTIPDPDVPRLAIWVGVPTYPHNDNDVLFQLVFDASKWNLVVYSLEIQTLFHRSNSGCNISTNLIYEPGEGAIIVDGGRQLRQVSYSTSAVGGGGIWSFVNYWSSVAGNGVGFAVNLSDRMDECLQDAEAVLETLKAVPAPSQTAIP